VFVESGPKHVARVLYAVDRCEEDGLVLRFQALLEQAHVLLHDLGNHRVLVYDLVRIEQQ